MGYPLRRTLEAFGEQISLVMRLRDLTSRISAEFRARRIRVAAVSVPLSFRSALITVADADAVADMPVLATMALLPDTAENGGDSSGVATVTARARAGAVDFLLSGAGYFRGAYTINYRLG